MGYSTGTLPAFRGPAETCGIYRSAHGARAAARACLRLCHRSISRAFAAGATWTSRTASAPWARRFGHTSVIDYAGTIYVIGGFGLTAPVYHQDVWASTDGGA